MNTLIRIVIESFTCLVTLILVWKKSYPEMLVMTITCCLFRSTLLSITNLLEHLSPCIQSIPFGKTAYGFMALTGSLLSIDTTLL